LTFEWASRAPCIYKNFVFDIQLARLSGRYAQP